MANDEHVALLNKGVDAWNKWRLETGGHRSITPGSLTPADARPRGGAPTWKWS